ncbi:hypothetical protein [Solirubrobacter soli]|uniref:hypothetical protein n=1 Tax=Solirubrobacter soli TaxID=363832 RepID=UPI00040C8852|nr:hypothetical protein [Solirubrobacter soli]
MVEFFDVRNADEASFREAWTAAARHGTALLRAIREDVQPRYAALSDPPADGGVVLLTTEPVELAPLRGRQGFIAGRRDGDVTVIHWSSPLMVARARVDHSIPGALYVHATLAGTQP